MVSSSRKPSSPLDTRVVYCGDNLEQLKKLPEDCIDLLRRTLGGGLLATVFVGLKAASFGLRRLLANDPTISEAKRRAQ